MMAMINMFYFFYPPSTGMGYTDSDMMLNVGRGTIRDRDENDST
jgi:hypothetical protein